MDAVEKAFQTQLKNIQTKTGQTADQLFALARKSGLTKHGEIRDFYKRELGLGHGDANSLTKFYLAQASGTVPGATGAPDEKADELYTGAKASLRPLHDKVMAAITKLGPFETAPKKTYLSLRRKKQFAMVGPGTKGRLEVGLNLKGVAGPARLEPQAPGGMCQYKVMLMDAKDVDKELAAWLKQAYDAAGE